MTASSPGAGALGTSGGPPTANDCLAVALDRFADALRRSTVEVRTGGASVGSGVVWHADGLIITNAHVTRAERVLVVTHDGRPLDGRVVAYDARRDLAAIVTAEGAATRVSALTAAPIGDLTALRPGDLLVALGNPLGIAGAVALGVVHTVDRGGRSGRPRWIRADIRLAPGNSGGPLADARGRVVGINTMIAGGLGIAVPVTTVGRFLVDAGIRTRSEEPRAA